MASAPALSPPEPTAPSGRLCPGEHFLMELPIPCARLSPSGGKCPCSLYSGSQRRLCQHSGRRAESPRDLRFPGPWVPEKDLALVGAHVFPTGNKDDQPGPSPATNAWGAEQGLKCAPFSTGAGSWMDLTVPGSPPWDVPAPSTLPSTPSSILQGRGHELQQLTTSEGPAQQPLGHSLQRL